MLISRPGRSDTGLPQEAIRLSKVIEQLSQDASFREKLLQSLDSFPDAWGLIGPDQRQRLRDFILKRNWSGIDHFPALTVRQLNASVSVANIAEKHANLTKRLAPPYVEVGPFSAGSGGEADWQAPAADLEKTFPNSIKDLGYGLTAGDPPHPELWHWHAQSLRAAYLLNRLALNRVLDRAHIFRVKLNGQVGESPEALIDLLERSGFDLWIEDARYFANFGHLHFKGQDVVMPFWLNTRIELPHSKDKLLVPVSHAEDEIRIRSPKGNADVSFYFGIDGMTEFRTMDTLDQYWVGKNVAHSYRQAQAVEVVRLLGKALNVYANLQHRYPGLPFNGYYRFGVCQDVVAAVEYHVRGRTSLFPITHDPAYFKGSGEIDQLFSHIPNDRRSSRVSWQRVKGSLPVKNFAEISIPELRRNLELVDQAEREGSSRKPWARAGITILLLIAGFLALLLFRRRPVKS